VSRIGHGTPPESAQSPQANKPTALCELSELLESLELLEELELSHFNLFTKTLNGTELLLVKSFEPNPSKESPPKSQQEIKSVVIVASEELEDELLELELAEFVELDELIKEDILDDSEDILIKPEDMLDISVAISPIHAQT
jgi:hypothetical protein